VTGRRVAAGPDPVLSSRLPGWGWWLGCALWAAVIFCFSTETFSSQHTGQVLQWIVALLGLHLDPHRFALLHTVVRKTAHLTEYAVLGILLWGGFSRTRGRGRMRAALWALLAAGAISLTDESHQFFVAQRTASLRDCAIDTTGAALGLLVLGLAGALLGRRKRS